MATDATRRRIEAVAAALPMHDRQDFDDARRGPVGRSEVRQVTADGVEIVFQVTPGTEAPAEMNLYLHDQSLRLINQGYTGAEVAELLECPPLWSSNGTRMATTPWWSCATASSTTGRWPSRPTTSRHSR